MDIYYCPDFYAGFGRCQIRHNCSKDVVINHPNLALFHELWTMN